MKISLNCKLDSAGAYGFIKPISDIKSISEISVFRDSKASECEKVTYFTPYHYRSSLLRNLGKLFIMLKRVNMSYSLAIGIYEIPHGVLAFIIGKLKNVPVVISIIGNPAYTKLRKGIRKKITYYMLKRSYAITVTGSKSKQFLVQEGFSSEKINILPNSININDFVPLKDINKKYDIISLGRLSSEKKISNLIKIIVLLKNKNPEIKVGIAGKGPEKEILQKLIFDCQLDENIFLLGYVDNIVDFYNSGKVFVLTSMTEGLPRTVIEAMACGIPCVTSNVGDMEDVIDDDVSGFLIQDYSNLDEYADRINKLLENKNKYDLMSENSIAKIRNNYSYKAATEVWKKIINQ